MTHPMLRRCASPRSGEPASGGEPASPADTITPMAGNQRLLGPMGLTQDGEGVRLGQLGADDTARQPGLPESIKAADWVSVTFGVASDVSAPRVP